MEAVRKKKNKKQIKKKNSDYGRSGTGEMEEELF